MQNCTKDCQHDLIWIYKEVSREIHFYLDVVENNFLYNYFTKLGSLILLRLEE